MLIKPDGNTGGNKHHSYELRASRMYTNCDCWRRNGLQDNCPRSMCQGKSGCMNLPNPNCGPSSYPMKLTGMTMGINRRFDGGSSKNQPDYTYPGMDASSPMSGYQEYQSDNMGMQMPGGGESYPPMSANGMSEPRSWQQNQQGNQQGNYPCYI